MFSGENLLGIDNGLPIGIQSRQDVRFTTRGFNRRRSRHDLGLNPAIHRPDLNRPVN